MSDGSHEHPAHPPASESHLQSEKPMSHGTEHHIEEAEHAQHAAHNPFDKRVALSMAIVAAALASVTLLSHRAHNEVLQLQLRASQSQIESNDKTTNGANQWAYFQAKKNRGYMYAAEADLLAVQAKDPPDSESGKKADDQIKKWRDKAKEYEADGGKIEEKARDLDEEAKELSNKAKEFDEEGEKAHHRGNFFDVGELGIELALVLCSVAVLTKRKPFWIAGIVIGVIGFAIAISGFFVEQLQPALHLIGLA